MPIIINGCFAFYDDGMPATVGDELPLPPYLTREQGQERGWVIEWLDGRTRPSKRYPAGRCRWLSRPERPVDLETAMSDVRGRATERAGGRLTYRLRNVYTSDVLMADIF